MIKYLDEKESTIYGLDFTFKIISKVFLPNKLMALYTIDKKTIQ